MGRKRKHTGLGDTVEAITKATGIDKLVKFIAGEDCGCDERKAKLNKLFPYRQPKCLTEQDYNYLDTFFKANKHTLTIKDQRELNTVYKNVFGTDLAMSSCSSCWRDYMSQLNKIYKEYETL